MHLLFSAASCALVLCATYKLIDCTKCSSLQRARGVVVSRLLRMQKALGSNPSGSIIFAPGFISVVNVKERNFSR